MVNKDVILELVNINKYFEKKHSANHNILDNVNLKIQEGEIVGLLGKSGSGKSTLLRIVAGLIEASSGNIKYKGYTVEGHRNWLSMVFQSFALFPWLTVLENVSIGLENKGLTPKEIKKRAIEAIDIIGLDGYESAYPKELSGGMKQRVGFARALVMKPEVLLLDEPFSALDVVTASSLKAELIDLWLTGKMGIKSLLIVTHNIEEAVLLCDKIVILSSHPGKIVSEIEVNIPHPRNREDIAVRRLVDKIYITMTNVLADKPMILNDLVNIDSKIPDVSTNKLNGTIDILISHPYMGKADLPQISESLKLTIDSLFPILEMMQILKFASVEHGDVMLTEIGEIYARSSIDERKKIFAEQLIKNVPLASFILLKLDESHHHYISRNIITKELAKTLHKDAANRILNTVINHGRYAEIFEYDASKSRIFLNQ